MTGAACTALHSAVVCEHLRCSHTPLHLHPAERPRAPRTSGFGIDPFTITYTHKDVGDVERCVNLDGVALATLEASSAPSKDVASDGSPQGQHKPFVELAVIFAHQLQQRIGMHTHHLWEGGARDSDAHGHHGHRATVGLSTS